MTEYAEVFGMEVIAWSQNLTAEAAAVVGVEAIHGGRQQESNSARKYRFQ
jgi:hypothetical protein